MYLNLLRVSILFSGCLTSTFTLSNSVCKMTCKLLNTILQGYTNFIYLQHKQYFIPVWLLAVNLFEPHVHVHIKDIFKPNFNVKTRPIPL